MSLHNDDHKHSNDYVEGTTDYRPEALASSYVPGTAEEKALVWKVDKHIVPCIWILYVAGYLDRANIGNARTGGLAADLNLSSNEYSVCLLLFFVSYVLFEIPSNLLIARVRPSLYLSGLCVIWGGVAASMAAINTWQALAAVRFCLGVIEAGFAPGVAFYLSSWYKKNELASRFSIYYTAVAISGAFSGLLAGVITQYMDGTNGIRGWRWLFLLEGVGSSACGLFTWYFMPDWPSTTKWLTPEERLLAAQRLAYDGVSSTRGAQGRTSEWQAIKMCFSDWRTWVFVVLYMLCTGAQTIQYFVPTLIGALGWTGYDGQYHTIPLYAVAFVFILSFCFAADYTGRKPMFIGIAASMGTIFFIILIAVNNNMVKYIFIILAFGCVYALPPLILTWVPNIISNPAEKRAVAIALVNGLGNSASIYGVFLWPTSDAPKYLPGFSATTAWLAVIAILSQVAFFLFKKYPAPVYDAAAAHQAEVERENAVLKGQE